MKTFTLYVILQLAASGSDAYLTQRNFGPHFQEHNPIARPFMKNNTSLGLYCGATAAGKIFIAHSLHRHRHDTLANIFEAGAVADNVGGSVVSYNGHTDHPLGARNEGASYLVDSLHHRQSVLSGGLHHQPD
jgi:hypothetical protein